MIDRLELCEVVKGVDQIQCDPGKPQVKAPTHWIMTSSDPEHIAQGLASSGELIHQNFVLALITKDGIIKP